MRDTTGLMTRKGGYLARRRMCLVAWIAGSAAVSAVGAYHSATTAANQDDSQRAHTPLRDITVPEAPPPVVVPPLDEVPAVQAAYERAGAQIEDGRFQDALDTLASVPEERGGDRHEIHYLLALAKTRLGQLDAARESAEAAARLGHGTADVHFLLAKLCRRQGEIESAIAHFRITTLAAERELNNPNVTLAWYYLGQTLAQAGYDLAAAEAYEQFDVAVWQTHPEHRNAVEINALLTGRPHGLVPERLELLRRLGRAREALHVAGWACETWPDDLYTHRLYAQALLSAGEPVRALTFCRERLEDMGSARSLLPVAVEAAQTAHRLEELVGSIARQVSEGRLIPQAAVLTRCLNRAGAPAQAVRLGRALLAQRPNDSDITWEVAAAQRATGDLRGALETLITFIRGKPELSELPQRRLAAWMGWLKSGVDVVELVKELRALPDADFATDFVLGVSALAADQLALADELLQSCVAARPDFAPAYTVQGQMLLATYQWDAAKAHADKVLKERPELGAAYFVLAEAHEGLDENEQAEQAYKQAVKLRPEEPAYKLALARHYRRAGNLLGAQRYFQEVLAGEPGNGEALEGLIDCYLLGDKVEIARAQLERLDQEAVPPDAWRRVNTLIRFLHAPFGNEHLAELKTQFEQYPDDVATARYLAGGLYQWGRLNEAYAVVKKTRARHPEDYHLTILQANVHALREEFDEAISLLEDLVKRFPNRLTVLEPLALYCVYDFRLEEGRPALRRLIELAEDEHKRSEYRDRLRDSFLLFGEFDDALHLVQGWIKSEPKNDRLLLHKAITLIHAERSGEAFAVLQEWLDRNPDDPDRRERFYRSVRATRQYEQTLERIRQWLDAEPSSAKLTEWLIDVLIWADRADEALAAARKFEGTYAESITRRIWLGRCQAAQGEIDKALAEFDALLNERLIEDSQRRDAWEQIVRTLVGADRIDEAVKRCDQWIKESEGLNPVFRPVALHWKRQALQAAGRDRDSAQVMEALLEYGPVLTSVLDDSGYDAGLFNDLGYVWVDLGMNLERATAMIRHAVAVDPWNAAFIDSLGWAYYKAGDFSNAHKYLARAVRLRDGQDAVVYDHLADAAYRLGDRDAARRHWSKALALLEAEMSEGERARPADLMTALRGKLAALERSEPPPLAPTASEEKGDKSNFRQEGAESLPGLGRKLDLSPFSLPEQQEE